MSAICPINLSHLKVISISMKNAKDYSIDIWKEKKGKSIYRIQTKSIIVHRKLMQRQGFELVAEGVNADLWVYRGEFSSIEKANQTIKSIIINR